MEQFLELFHPLPGNRYLHVSTEKNSITTALQSKLDAVGGKLSVALYNEDNLAFHAPFRALPREHDKVILQDVFSKHQKQSALLKITYTTLANAADLILLEKKGVMEIEWIKEFVTEHEFRSVNHIGDLMEGYDVITAKKMHMWGNGL